VRVIFVGDTHGDISWFRHYLLPVAKTLNAKALVVLGDFGAWEHTSDGVRFMNEISRAATLIEVEIYWLHGNHDKFSHTLEHYGDQRTEDGFVICRENVFYIPQGHSWSWGKVSLRAFGGAYSVDKAWRLDAEKARERGIRAELRRTVGSGKVTGSDLVPSQAETLWFPEEEMTDDEMEQLLLDDFGPKDIILSHDKPMSAKPDWNRKDFPACMPNQLRLERALRLHRPKWWFHGHLHYYYKTSVGAVGWRTTVVGLEPNSNAAEHSSWQRENTFVYANLLRQPMIELGNHTELPEYKLNQARKILSTLD
jgi:calcineurin-like phosphoesterase family protein